MALVKHVEFLRLRKEGNALTRTPISEQASDTPEGRNSEILILSFLKMLLET